MAVPATASEPQAQEAELQHIPVIETGPDFPLATLRASPGKTHALLDIATRRYPRRLLTGLDRISRAWLVRWNNVHLDEIDAIAGVLGRPGAYFFSINYEWACTCRAAASPDGRSARLIRVLDWKTPGLGRNIVCAKVNGAKAGPFAVMTWPGYTGILQVMAPGRFSASLNQAPMRDPTGLFYLDWAANRRRVWKMPHPTPAHLLRKVAEEARDFAEARRMLSERPISTPAIFTLAGISPDETAVIERTEHASRVRDKDAVAANHWDEAGWPGQSRGEASRDRADVMRGTEPQFDPQFAWLAAPVLNEKTRLAMVADAKEGRLVARGYEATGPATETLEIIWDAAL
ncbi:hypothetical protein [Hyphomicrobium sp. 99]|uniref:hypothetical protein n=1 Tax=Hyphomicrobium sp. 99 TaxID=1163419 RepID=UPI0005F781EE|nr:hypothetical protein [Hyphomicrobium sp. 99]